MKIGDKIRSFFQFNSGADYASDRRMVLTILLISMIGATAMALADVNRPQMMFLGLVMLVCYLLALRGLLLPGRLLAPLAALILFSFLIFKNYGIHDTAILGLAVVQVCAGLLMGRRGTLLYGTLSLTVVIVLGIMDNQGIIQNSFGNHGDFADYLVAALSLVVISLVQMLMIGRLNQAMKLARETEVAEKKASQALRDNTATLQALVGALPDAIFRIDRENVFVDFIPSRDFTPLVSPEEFIGRPVDQVLPKELSQQIGQAVATALKTGEVQTIKYSMMLGEEPSYYEARIIRVDDRSVISVVRDIGAQAAYEAERDMLLAILQRRNQQLQTAAEVARRCTSILEPRDLVRQAVDLIQDGFGLYYVGLFLVPPGGGVAILEAGTGLAGQEMLAAGHHLPLGQPSMVAWSINHRTARIAQHADMDEVWQRNPHLPETRSEMAVPLLVRGEAIGALTIQSQVESAFREEDIATLQAMADQLAIAIDNARLFTAGQQELAERQRAERALQQERDFAVQVMNALGQGVTVTNVDGRFEFVNPAYAALLGRTADELIDQRPYDFTHPDDQAILVDARNRRRQGEVSQYELRLVHQDGHSVDVLITGSPRWRERQIIGSISVITDLTERKRGEAERETLIRELSAKNAELERFTYTVSHDLKSPLVTIRGFIGYLEQDARAGNIERLTADIARIQNAASKMERLLEELLELSRIGRKMNPPTEAPFAEIARDAVALAEGRLRSRGVQVTIDPDLPSVFGDRIRLVEVVQNLVDNAAKFMGDQPEPHIQIGARQEDDQTVFFVRDNGIGIDPRFHDKVFGLFDKLDAQSEGTGVGLALVKRIVEVHGGRIWIESQPGQGATFCFTLTGG